MDYAESLEGMFKGLEDETFSVFNNQRRAVPRTHQDSNDIRMFSKHGVDAVLYGDVDEAGNIESDILEKWESLRSQRGPTIFVLQMCADAGKELVEFLVVRRVFPYIAGEMEEIDFQSRSWQAIMPDNIGMEDMYPVWFFGAVDAISELSRMVDRYMALHQGALRRSERMKIRKNFLRIAENWYNFLDYVQKNVVPQVMDDFNKWGFRGSFRSVLSRVRYAMGHQLDLVNIAIEMTPDHS
jgi:predicted translin family RNA/ssDNA-binding protein